MIQGQKKTCPKSDPRSKKRDPRSKKRGKVKKKWSKVKKKTCPIIYIYIHVNTIYIYIYVYVTPIWTYYCWDAIYIYICIYICTYDIWYIYIYIIWYGIWYMIYDICICICIYPLDPPFLHETILLLVKPICWLVDTHCCSSKVNDVWAEDGNTNRIIMPLGQSGHFVSKHYNDARQVERCWFCWFWTVMNSLSHYNPIIYSVS